MCKMQCVNGSASRTSWTDQLDGPVGRTSWTGKLDGPAGWTRWTDQLDGPAGRTSWTDQLDGPVLFIWSLGQFAYSKIDLLVCTLSQLLSPTKALFRKLNEICIKFKMFNNAVPYYSSLCHQMDVNNKPQNYIIQNPQWFTTLLFLQ